MLQQPMRLCDPVKDTEANIVVTGAYIHKLYLSIYL